MTKKVNFSTSTSSLWRALCGTIHCKALYLLSLCLILSLTTACGDSVSTNTQPVIAEVTQQPEPKADIDISMVSVEGGTFTMGCTNEQGDDCESIEKPSHKVTLSSYSIGKYEVTQAQWKAVMGNNPSKFSGCDSCPVEQVSWSDIQEFIKKLNEKTGKTYRLPTEAEWEYAARGGNKSKGYKYSGNNDIDAVAWCHSNSNTKTHPFGEKTANELGIHDMSGNVTEWCSDWTGEYSASDQTNPNGVGTGTTRVLRGGGWDFHTSRCRSSSRIGSYPDYRYSNGGFRLVLAA